MAWYMVPWALPLVGGRLGGSILGLRLPLFWEATSLPACLPASQPASLVLSKVAGTTPLGSPAIALGKEWAWENGFSTRRWSSASFLLLPSVSMLLLFVARSAEVRIDKQTITGD